MNNKLAVCAVLTVLFCLVSGFIRVNADPGRFENNFNTSSMQFLGDYIKDAKKISIKISVDPGTGLIKSLRVSFAEALVGDFKRNNKGLKIKNADIEIKDILINPDKPVAGNFSILSTGGIYLYSAEANEKDLADLMAARVKNMKNIRIKIYNGSIELKALYKEIKLEAIVKLYKPLKGNPGINMEIIRLKAGVITIPRRLANYLIRRYNPFFNRLKLPAKLYYGDIYAENGVLKIY